MTADWKDALAALTGLPEGEAGKESECPQPASEDGKVKAGKQKPLHVVVEKKGRGGKTATIVEGFECTDEELNEIARDLRRRLGTGGSARGGEILIQGDRRNDVMAMLREKGFKIN